MTTGAFDDPTGNGDAFGQRLVIVEVGRVVEEIVRTVIHGPPIRGGYGPARGTPADARRDSARLPAQDLQQVRSDPAILFLLVVGNEGQRRFPDILRHMDEVHDDGHGDLPRHRKLLEMTHMQTESGATGAQAEVSILQIFLAFLIIGATSFGGVVPYLRRSLVTKRRRKTLDSLGRNQRPDGTGCRHDINDTAVAGYSLLLSSTKWLALWQSTAH